MDRYRKYDFYIPLMSNLDKSEHVKIISAVPIMNGQLIFHIIARAREVDITQLLQGELVRATVRVYELPDGAVLEYAKYSNQMLRIPLSLTGDPLTLKEYRDMIIGRLRVLELFRPIGPYDWVISMKEDTISVIKRDGDVWTELHITPINRTEAMLKGGYINFNKQIKVKDSAWKDINIYNRVLKVRVNQREKIMFIESGESVVKHVTGIEFEGIMSIVELSKLLDIMEDVIVLYMEAILGIE